MRSWDHPERNKDGKDFFADPKINEVIEKLSFQAQSRLSPSVQVITHKLLQTA